MYDDNLPTPQKRVENLLERMNNDFNNGSYNVVCEQLPDVWNAYKDIIMSVDALHPNK
jgi:hypothetical protein